jgi:hypothetical protein
MKVLGLVILLASCTVIKPKFFANDIVVFKWSERGKFWSKACPNVGKIINYERDSGGILYTIKVECTGWTGAAYQQFSVRENQIIGIK